MSGISLRERVKNSLQDDILSGVLKPGDKLDEQLVASRSKASRRPVREAINQLAMNGLIELHENRGAFVSRISVTQVIHMFEVLNTLEATCARYAAQRITDREMRNLKKLSDKGLEIAKRKDLDAYAAYNRDELVQDPPLLAPEGLPVPIRDSLHHFPARLQGIFVLIVHLPGPALRGPLV